ncbi:hypothetical protein PF005_g7697 [Phytophthora fragariae]|uniref:MTHFR SAM-binding regulatory domain-containing protein n=1 Tax=Phytophthora fragariae TaxID=53985 RepID=A0A6A3YJH0_9STRA|nr:hypothetical protein PF005_g7697 [Phytophthora fragariae]
MLLVRLNARTSANNRSKPPTTINSDPSIGWGGNDGVVFPKAYVEFFVAPEKMAHLVKVMRRDYPQHFETWHLRYKGACFTG